MDEQVVGRYLVDRLCLALFRLPGPSRLRTILEAMPPAERLGLDEALQLLRSDPRVAPVETRWDLAHRRDLGERPLGGALEAILEAFGRPMPAALLISELCLAKTGDPDDFRAILDRLARADGDLGFDGELYYRRHWLANTAASEDDRLLYLNGLTGDAAFAKARAKLLGSAMRGRTPLDTAEAVVKAFGQPMPNQALGILLWKHHGDRFEAAETLSAMVGDERFVALGGPSWLAGTSARNVLKAAAKRQGVDLEPATDPDLAEVLQAPRAQRLKMSEDAVRRCLHLAESSRTPVSLAELLGDVLELRPRQRNFAPAAHAMEDLLGANQRLIRVQRGEYLNLQGPPDWVRSVPEALEPKSPSLSPREQSPDVLLRPDELSPELAAHLLSAFYDDVGEPEVTVTEVFEDETRIAIPYHHCRLGTMRLRACDRRLFEVGEGLSMVTLILPTGSELPVWANGQTRLFYGLLEFYETHLHPTGSLLTITRVPDRQRAYELSHDGATDPATYIGRERLAQLTDLRERLSRRRMFLLDLLSEVLGQSDKGLAFDQLWSQVNVLRRTSRLQVASLLESYEQFQPGAGGRWTVAN